MSTHLHDFGSPAHSSDFLKECFGSYAHSEGVTQSSLLVSVLASTVEVSGEVHTNISSGASVFVQAFVLIDARSIESLDVSLGAFAEVAARCIHALQLDVLGAVVQLFVQTLVDV